jgi:RHS repeat-associated protein
VSARDEEGKVLRQFDVPYPWFSTQAWSWVEDYVYREGQFLAAERPAAEGGRRHFHLDHLGSPRLVTGPSGQQVAAHDYYPFGVEITPLRQETTAGLDREDPMKFTGHERDFNIGTLTENSNYNDYMHARFTTPQWGRFLSVDPKLDVEKTIQAPQWWNRYSYALNNPLRYTDPDGREVTITIKRDTYTSESVTATIEVKSDVKGVNSFSGFTLETTHAGDSGTKDPIPAGTYDASVRTDHTPNRVELQNVPGYDNVQIHVGNTKDDVKGCFAAGTTRTTDTVAESKSAMTSILAVISNDNSGIIKVTVEGSPTKPPPPPVKPPVKP